MHLDGSFVLSEPRPWKQGQAQVDRSGIEGVYRLLQIHGQWIVDIEGTCNMDQHLREVGIDAPVSILVGVGQRVSGDASANAHVIELRLDGTKAGLDVPKTLAIGELGECHAKELVQTRKTQDLVIAPVSPDALPEIVHRQELDELGENGAASIHRPSLRNRNGHRVSAN